jgi:Uma2 family endonuclease
MRTLIDQPEVEYLDGHPYPKMSPKATHAFVQGAFIRVLHSLGGALGKTLPELRCHIGAVDDTKTEFVPDVAFILNERWYALPADRREEPPFAPDIAVEIRSPGEKARYREHKIARYLATGAQLVLDVDPRSRAIYVYDDQGMRVFRTHDRFEDARLSWLAFDVARVFEDLEP